MNRRNDRAQKVAVLSNLLQGNDNARAHLQHVADSLPQPRVLVDDLAYPDQVTDSSPVTFQHNGARHYMTLTAACEYARLHQVRLMMVTPENPGEQMNGSSR